ncbi:MAG: hypothetical protein GY799_26870 [Desulfobulbaceae bacterium]|nr:hypothetical protein [Desulfobulbaceae bacterium]
MHTDIGPDRSYPQVGPNNVLLAKIKELPDRTDNIVDAANFYDWRDRLLLQIGTMGSTPATIPFGYIVHFDESDAAWLIQIELEVTSLSYVVKATVIRRYMLIAESLPDDYDYTFFTSASQNLSGFSGSHGLSGLGSFSMCNQNPRGDKVLIGQEGNFTTPVTLGQVIAHVTELTISGTVDPLTGSGLSGLLSVYKDVDDCVEEADETIVGELINYFWYGDANVSQTCSGVPGTGQRTTEEGNAVKVVKTTEISIYPTVIGLYTETTTQRHIISAFYNEDGLASVIEEETEEYDEYDYDATFSKSSESEKNYTVTSSTPDPYWSMTSSSSSFSWSYSRSHNRIRSFSRELLIDGIQKELLKTVTVYTVDKNSSDSGSGTPGDDSGQAPCAGYDIDSTSGPYDPENWPGAVFTYVDTFTIVSNGGDIYDGARPAIVPAINFAVDYTYNRQLSNRVYGLGINGTLATQASIGEWYGAHTDLDGIQGSVSEYAAYDPYSQTVETDSVEIGFV